MIAVLVLVWSWYVRSWSWSWYNVVLALVLEVVVLAWCWYWNLWSWSSLGHGQHGVITSLSLATIYLLNLARFWVHLLRIWMQIMIVMETCEMCHIKNLNFSTVCILSCAGCECRETTVSAMCQVHGWEVKWWGIERFSVLLLASQCQQWWKDSLVDQKLFAAP